MQEEKLSVLREQIRKRLAELLPHDFYKFDEAALKHRIESLVSTLIRQSRYSLTHAEQKELVYEMFSEVLGLGPLEKLLEDKSIYEIMVNGPGQVYIERNGKIELTEIKFRDDDHLMFIVERILSPLGRHVTELEPYIDARLKDGSRVNVIKSPISLYGTILTIRKFTHRILAINDLIKLGALEQLIAEFLEACVKARLNIVVSGGTSTGKTTLLSGLMSFIDKHERVITIEDTAELQLGDRHKVCLETRPPSSEGKGEIIIRELVKNALHMRPDRIIIGEVRSEEALDMLQAMNTGQAGSMATVHSNSPADTFLRLETMALMGNPNMTSMVVRRQIISAVDLIIHQIRLADGTRRTSNITEIIKSTDGSYHLEDIFRLQTITDSSGQSQLKLLPTGIKPEFYNRLKKEANYSLPEFER